MKIPPRAPSLPEPVGGNGSVFYRISEVDLIQITADSCRNRIVPAIDNKNNVVVPEEFDVGVAPRFKEAALLDGLRSALASSDGQH